MIYGTLNDAEIKKLGQEGKLIIEDFSEKNVKQACYELRAGDTYFNLTEGATRHTVEDGEIILFKPHQTIVIITKEKFHLPADILARFLLKGALFSVGFAPVNTYADPGFYGRMGIVMNNASNNYLKIKSGDIIAKVEFDRLQTPVETPYHGQHGFETGVWPMRSDYIVNRKELNRYLAQNDVIQEIEAAYGEPVAQIMQRILITERSFVFATGFLIIANLIIIGLSLGTQWLEPIATVILGIVTNLCYPVISSIITKFEWRKRKK